MLGFHKVFEYVHKLLYHKYPVFVNCYKNTLQKQINRLNSQKANAEQAFNEIKAAYNKYITGGCIMAIDKTKHVGEQYESKNGIYEITEDVLNVIKNLAK